LGSTTLGTFTILGTDITGSVIATDYHWKIDGRLSPQTGPGTTSNVGFYGTFTVVGTTANTVIDIAVIGTSINTTISNNLNINVAWSVSAANDSITANYMLCQQINAIGGVGGSVSSVGLTAPSIFTVSGSPITSSGNLSFVWNAASTAFVKGDGSTTSSTLLTNFAALANPGTNGYVLSSTTAGVLSWIAPGGGTITLTGDVTGSGTSSIATTLAASISGTHTFTGVLTANGFGVGYQAVATTAGTTTLTATSPNSTEFTGATTQTCVLPNATTLILGQRFCFDNNSTGLVTIQTNGGATLWIMAAGTGLSATCSSIGTAAGTWELDYLGANIATGKKFVSNNTLTVAGTDGTTMTFPTTSATIARTDAANSFTGNQTILGNLFSGSGTLSFIPAVPVNMLSAVAGTNKTLLNIINTGGGAGAGSSIDFFTYDVTGGTSPSVRISALDNNFSGAFVVYTKNPGAAANAMVERFRIAETGVMTTTGQFTSSGGGIGYATGAGGTVTQATSRTTGVTLSKLCGTITLFTTTLAAVTSQAFVLTNTFIAATDFVMVQHTSGGTLGLYEIAVAPAAGSCTITIRNNSAAISASEAPVLRFVVIKAVTA
jgi:hypothetical protein